MLPEKGCSGYGVLGRAFSPSEQKHPAVQRPQPLK
jgi:hypothetical protein